MSVPDLHKALTLYIEKSRKTTNEVTSGLQKWYGDSPDLSRRYKGKEEQLQQVKSRAPKVWHELRQMWLYEDFEFTGSASTAEKDVSTESLRVKMQIKAKPKPKNAKKRTSLEAALPDDAVTKKKVSDGLQKRQLRNMKAKIKNARADTDRAIAEDSNGSVPAAIRHDLNRWTSELDGMDADVDLAMNGDNVRCDIDTISRKVYDVLEKHTISLKGFTNVRKTIAKAAISGA